MRHTWCLVALTIVAGACGGSAGPAPPLDEIGDPCRDAYDHCLDDVSVRSCQSGVWTERSCDSVCADQGPAYVASGCDDECACVLEDPDGCTPGESVCLSDELLGTCDDTQTLQQRPCTEICADAGLEPVACVEGQNFEPAGCWCTAAGTACSDEPDRCVDESTLASCEAGVWAILDCPSACGGSGSCDPLGVPAVCDCS
jgi:hypothetical protein